MTLEEKNEMLADGLSLKRREYFRSAKYAGKMSKMSLDEYINFLMAAKAFVSNVPTDLKRSTGTTYQL